MKIYSHRRLPPIPFKCGNTKRYKGICTPRCSGGTGCGQCWWKYVEVQVNKGSVQE